MRYQEALSAFKAGKATKFVLAGAEAFLKGQFASVVRSSMDASVFRPDEAGEALSRLQSDGLFKGARATILEGFDKMSPERFVGALEGTSDVVVMIVGERADLKSRAMTEVLTFSAGVSCERLKEYGSDYPEWIASVIAEAGFSADEGVAAHVFRRVGPDMSTTARELDKLMLVRAGSKRITVDDVVRFVSLTARATSFEILDALLKKDVAGAVARHASFYGHSSDGSLELAQFLGSYFEKLLRMLLLREQGFGPDEVADIVGIPRFLVKTRYLPAALALGKSNVLGKLDALCDVDARIRTFKGDKRIILDRFIYSFF